MAHLDPWTMQYSTVSIISREIPFIIWFRPYTCALFHFIFVLPCKFAFVHHPGAPPCDIPTFPTPENSASWNFSTTKVVVLFLATNLCVYALCWSEPGSYFWADRWRFCASALPDVVPCCVKFLGIMRAFSTRSAAVGARFQGAESVHIVFRMWSWSSIPSRAQTKYLHSGG